MSAFPVYIHLLASVSPERWKLESHRGGDVNTSVLIHFDFGTFVSTRQEEHKSVPYSCYEWVFNVVNRQRQQQAPYQHSLCCITSLAQRAFLSPQFQDSENVDFTFIHLHLDYFTDGRHYIINCHVFIVKYDANCKAHFTSFYHSVKSPFKWRRRHLLPSVTVQNMTPSDTGRAAGRLMFVSANEIARFSGYYRLFVKLANRRAGRELPPRTRSMSIVRGVLKECRDCWGAGS